MIPSAKRLYFAYLGILFLHYCVVILLYCTLYSVLYSILNNLTDLHDITLLRPSLPDMMNMYSDIYCTVETRMVGSELNIFSNNLWRIYTQAYGDLLESPHYPPQVAAL